GVTSGGGEGVGRMWCTAAVVVFRWRGGSGGGSTVVAAGRVRESGINERIDRETSNLFGFAGKIPPEKFSGGDVVAAAGGCRWWGVGRE
nr:hypothetical protein [Tanacetum cinerariifolium]